jgi:hypothetical protein
MKRSQSSLNAFISEENQTDPENITHYKLMLRSSYMKFEKDIITVPYIRGIEQFFEHKNNSFLNNIGT